MSIRPKTLNACAPPLPRKILLCHFHLHFFFCFLFYHRLFVMFIDHRYFFLGFTLYIFYNNICLLIIDMSLLYIQNTTFLSACITWLNSVSNYLSLKVEEGRACIILVKES